MLMSLKTILSSTDWIRVTSVLQAFLTPVVAIATVVLGFVTVRIQRSQARAAQQQADTARQQAETARQQAETNRLQYRLAMFEKRMKVFNTTMELLGAIARDARVELDQLFTFIRETRDDVFLFGPEIDEYINEIYRNGVELNTREFTGEHGQEAIARRTELLQWLVEQMGVAKTKFLKYLDFREP